MTAKNNQTTNKKQLLNYVVVAGLLLGGIGVISIPGAIAQSDQGDTSDMDSSSYEELERQYNAILESYGFSEPELTEAQEAELDEKLAPLDAEYDKIFAGSDSDEELTAQQEAALVELDKKYDAILESFGFKFPELTEAQEAELEAKLAPLEEKFMDVEGYYDDEDYYHDDIDLTPEQQAQVESLDKQYDAILEEFGFKYPELTEAQEAELNERFMALDEEYEAIFSQFNGDLSESEGIELNRQLDALNEKETSILSEFGFVEPQLTEAQEVELDERLAPLDAQYDEIFGDSEEECDQYEDNYDGERV